MSRLADAIYSALLAHVHTLADPQEQRALPALEREDVLRACERAAARLRRNQPAAARLLLMLADPQPAVAALCEAAVVEYVLHTTADSRRIAVLYRQLPQHADLPPWSLAGPMLLRFFGELLPAAMAEQPRLRLRLPRRATTPLPAQAPLQERLVGESQQLLVAAEGAQIANVRQLVVHGDYYSTPDPALPDLGLLFTRYRAYLLETFGALDFRGIMQLQAATRINLEQIYVPLVGRRRDAPAAMCDLHQQVRDEPLLVVIGDPGSGKSTLVRYTLLSLARAETDDRLGLAADWLPIFFPVAAFAAARAQPGQADLAPLSYLATYYHGRSQPDYVPLFQRALELGAACVLLDGLDEIRSDRRQIVAALEAFVRQWDGAGNRFLATSRIIGYDDAPLDPHLFPVVEILPLDEARTATFIERWSYAFESIGMPPAAQDQDLLTDLVRHAAHSELERRVRERTQALAAAVYADPRVAELARNPLMLTILALIHQQGARLPDRRVDLYRLCVQVLAETWNRTRSLSGRAVDLSLGNEPIDERFVVNLLGPLALWIHRSRPGGLVELEELQARIAATLIQIDSMPAGRARRLADEFIELMRRDTGLLQERGFRRFGFLHLTFEEYLAARGLLESVTIADLDALLHEYCLDPRWREVLRLTIASAPQREAQRLILHLLKAPARNGDQGRAAVLAGQCLLDIGRHGATGRAWVQVHAAVLELTINPQIATPIRLEAGAVLGDLGDPRRLDSTSGRPVGAAADYWCHISAGTFWHGEGSSAAPRRRGLRKQRIDYDYWIARYPVSNAEYGQFIRAGGYRELRWWTPEGRRFLQQADAARSQGPIAAPGLWGVEPFAGPAQPVVGVSWYEAAAYCAWLSATGHRHGWLAQHEVLRLPSALEWERAARHTDRRRYPWGDAGPDPERACYVAGGHRAPVAIGCYPAGAAACGALDMAGNVWEWTASNADDPAATRPLPDVAAHASPLIKGGAFNWDGDMLQCGAHYWFSPARRYNLLGFRIMRAPLVAAQEEHHDTRD